MRVLPNAADVTVAGVSDVSFRFWPVRATSLWYVTTSTGATVEVVRDAATKNRSPAVTPARPRPI